MIVTGVRRHVLAGVLATSLATGGLVGLAATAEAADPCVTGSTQVVCTYSDPAVLGHLFIPAGVTSANAVLHGGDGGAGAGDNGGLGGQGGTTHQPITVEPGWTLDIYVGAKGHHDECTGSGADGGRSGPLITGGKAGFGEGSQCGGGSGGGGSYIVKHLQVPTETATVPLAVAGGGAGGGGGTPGGGGAGGAGGGDTAATDGVGAGGGGAGGTAVGTGGTVADGNTPGVGNTAATAGGGGGGGGYRGGGGGTGGAGTGGGGGGSGFPVSSTAPSGTTTVEAPVDGSVTITFDKPTATGGQGTCTTTGTQRSCLFSDPTRVETFTVPAHTGPLTVTVTGGHGGHGAGDPEDNTDGGAGGAGGVTTTTLNVRTGDVLDIYVGGDGEAGSACPPGSRTLGGVGGLSGGIPTGGDGGSGDCAAGGGGGGTFVTQHGAAFTGAGAVDPLAAAGGGGGGGGGGFGGGEQEVYNFVGGAGGGPVGQPGGMTTESEPPDGVSGGGGGTATGGGASGGLDGLGGTAGTRGFGGAGTNGSPGCGDFCSSGGGGGGGYFGGGGGGRTAGGGGGSGFPGHANGFRTTSTPAAPGGTPGGFHAAALGGGSVLFLFDGPGGSGPGAGPGGEGPGVYVPGHHSHNNDPNPNTNPDQASQFNAGRTRGEGAAGPTASAICEPKVGVCTVRPAPGPDSAFAVTARDGRERATLTATMMAGSRPDCPDYRELNQDWVAFGFKEPGPGSTWRKSVSWTSTHTMARSGARSLAERMQICYEAPYRFLTRSGYRLGHHGHMWDGVLHECSAELDRYAARHHVAAPCVSSRRIVRVRGGWLVTFEFRIAAGRQDPKALG